MMYIALLALILQLKAQKEPVCQPREQPSGQRNALFLRAVSDRNARKGFC